MTANRNLQIVADASALARAAADVFVDTAKRAVAANGRFTVVLSGGTTPKALYSLLANDPALRAQVPWHEIFFFFGDERCVPPDHPDSNYCSANEAMFSQVGVQPERVFRIKGEARDPDGAAAEYEQELRAFFALAPSQLPRFDLLMLGMGPDGHTASLFPGTTAIEERSRLVVANWVGKLQSHRITLTVPVLNSAASVLFLVQGKDKSAVLKAVLEGPYDPIQLPSQFVQPNSGALLWLADESAAALLDRDLDSTRSVQCGRR